MQEIAIALISSLTTAFLAWLRSRKKQHQPSTMPRVESEKVSPGLLVRLLREQQGRCAISGVKLTSEQASIDRPDGNGTARLVRRDIKRLKGKMPDDEFREICRVVAQHSPA